ncbi:DUF927 domain-containing protein [Paracoccus sp. Z118]|uniref:DUF927 domain-containing protein n=1 Tax=Paracoccus sp. Z118 TaxID=2851017 RepID=UPI001C2C96AC|nr:DUF927 domain-containing protein [Paracoccus sp. Z118]MBV0892964.1 DUF927 domain-containing protein [Paracoccus sp. Z118]
MTIHHHMQEIGLPHVRDPDALCCTFVMGILPQQETPASGDEPASSPERLAPAVPVQQSNGPTARAAGTLDPDLSDGAFSLDGQPYAQMGGGVGEAAAAESREDPDLRRFYDDLHLTLPPGFLLDEEVPCIKDDKGQKISAPIRVVSHARRADGTGWMLEIELLDGNFQLQRLSLSRADLHCKPRVVLSMLADRGFRIFCLPEAVPVFLQLWEHVPRSLRAEHPGWFENPAGPVCYLRPDGSRHAPADIQNEVFLAGPRRSAQDCAGSLAGWQGEVAERALGNPALIFAISAALAGPLLRIASLQTAGFNVHGPRASGKSLLLHVAMSCAGHPDRVIPWPAASTGLQRLSAEAQDGLLALDGYPLQPDGRQVRTLLALGEDAGAGRALSERDPDGGQRWRRVILSSSEIPLDESLRRSKKAPPAALLRRMIDLPADTGAHGLIEVLHGAPDGASFARTMELALRRHHGHLLPAFLDQLVEGIDLHSASLTAELPVLAGEIRDHCARTAPLSPAAQPAGAERFALVGYAGEMAIGFGLLPWPTGTAHDAALQLAGRAHHACPTDGWDGANAVVEIRGFIDRHAGRIIDLEAEPAPESVPDPVGWQDREHVYLRSEPVRDEVADLDAMLAAIDEILVPGGEARSRQYRMPASKVADRPRVYRLAKAGLD